MKEEYLELLRSIKRDGIDRLISWISDIFVTKWVIFASVIWSFLISMFFLLFLRCCAGIIVFLILVGIFVGLVIICINYV